MLGISVPLMRHALLVEFLQKRPIPRHIAVRAAHLVRFRYLHLVRGFIHDNGSICLVMRKVFLIRIFMPTRILVSAYPAGAVLVFAFPLVRAGFRSHSSVLNVERMIAVQAVRSRQVLHLHLVAAFVALQDIRHVIPLVLLHMLMLAFGLIAAYLALGSFHVPVVILIPVLGSIAAVDRIARTSYSTDATGRIIPIHQIHAMLTCRIICSLRSLFLHVELMLTCPIMYVLFRECASPPRK